jgi:hypothetical protein
MNSMTITCSGAMRLLITGRVYKNADYIPSVPKTNAAQVRAGPRHWLSQRRANPSNPWGMKMTMAMKMTPTGMR